MKNLEELWKDEKIIEILDTTKIIKNQRQLKIKKKNTHFYIQGTQNTWSLKMQE